MQCRHGNGAVGSMVDLIVDISPIPLLTRPPAPLLGTMSRGMSPASVSWPLTTRTLYHSPDRHLDAVLFWLLGPGAGEIVDCVVCGGAVGGGRYAVRIEQGNIKRRPLRPPRQHLTPVRRIWAKTHPDRTQAAVAMKSSSKGNSELAIKNGKDLPSTPYNRHSDFTPTEAPGGGASWQRIQLDWA